MTVADGKSSILTAQSRALPSPARTRLQQAPIPHESTEPEGAVPNSEAAPTVLGARERCPVAQVRELPAVARWRSSCYSDRCPGGSGGRREGAPLGSSPRIGG